VAVLPEIKRLGPEADYSAPSSAEMKSEWSHYTSVPFQRRRQRHCHPCAYLYVCCGKNFTGQIVYPVVSNMVQIDLITNTSEPSLSERRHDRVANDRAAAVNCLQLLCSL
jgi:hypothetical protein